MRSRKSTLAKRSEVVVTYSFRGKVWKHRGPGGWHFITLPKKISTKIRKEFGYDEEGWGRLKAIIQIGKTEWNTAIWFDTKADSYLLPIKVDIRKKEKITNGLTTSVLLKFPPSDFANWS